MDGQDRELLRKAVRGDEAALERLLEAYAPRVESALRIDRKWQSVLDSADVLQVTFLEAFLRIGDFDPEGPGSFEGWLTRIAQNNLRDAIRFLRSQKRPPPEQRLTPAARDDTATAFCEQLGVTSTTPSRTARREDVVRMLENALAALPASYAQAVRLYDLEGRPIQEAAAKMNRSAGAVHMLRARAMDRLRDILGGATNFFSTGS